MGWAGKKMNWVQKLLVCKPDEETTTSQRQVKCGMDSNPNWKRLKHLVSVFP